MVYIRSAFILIFLSSPCQSNDQLTQTKPLLLEDTLISEGGDFALGFFSPTNSSKKLYIGIWYHRVTERTVVWVANRDNPITTPSAMLAITDNLELVLSDSQGHTLWMATGNTSGDAGGAASAVLLNSGNFVLRLPNGTEVWHSFDHPTDTILPTMRILLSFKTQPATRLIAWKGPDNPSTGDISSGMDSTNLQMFIWKGALPYYRFPVVNDMAVAGAMYQQSNGNAAIMYETRVNAGDALYYTYTVSSGSPYTRFSLDYTGKGRLLSWNSTTSSWTVIIEHPHSCDLYASCGPFSYCDQMGPLPTTCQCPDGFELLNSLNFSRGCRRKEELKCGVGNYFMAMSSMKLPDKFLHIKNRTFDQCADECTRNCSCMAYAYANLSSIGAVGDTSRCLVWSGDLIDMEKNSFSEVLYIRLGGSVRRKSSLLKILLPIILCVLLLMLGALVWTCKSRGKRQKKRVQKRRMLEYLSSTDDAGDKNINFPFISFENIVTATDNFSESNLLGKGGFGKVYKGMLEGTKEVAVKRLSTGSGQGKEEFKNEVVLIAKLQHKNLVKLLGCCIHEDEKLLVYEYLPNKSLDYFLFASARKSMLQWPTRFKIIQGVARGIMYLHHDSRLTVIHRDLKASNILLDKEMNPKISDFGMARIFSGDQLQANTNRVVGTYGYMSPEYAMKGAFSVKSDTYSFGVLILEIVSGLKISSPYLIMDFSNLITFVSIGRRSEFRNIHRKTACKLNVRLCHVAGMEHVERWETRRFS
uniref:Receptor-like serine/threonine-protein kinase n=1 Tax=Zea mays TaxID=4577 RepID=A0A804M9V6_MAIZE